MQSSPSLNASSGISRFMLERDISRLEGTKWGFGGKEGAKKTNSHVSYQSPLNMPLTSLRSIMHGD